MGLVLGEAEKLNNTSSGVPQTFAFALLVVVLVLAAQFESFISAMILMSTVPFGLAAAMYAILLTGGSINIYSEIGLVMLVGLMSKNGILIVEFANQLRDMASRCATPSTTPALIRLRPVVMTMIATVFGGLPLLLTSGAGAEARRALGWIIVGGLGFATSSRSSSRRSSSACSPASASRASPSSSGSRRVGGGRCEPFEPTRGGDCTSVAAKEPLPVADWNRKWR